MTTLGFFALLFFTQTFFPSDDVPAECMQALAKLDWSNVTDGTHHFTFDQRGLQYVGRGGPCHASWVRAFSTDDGRRLFWDENLVPTYATCPTSLRCF